jgi:hypothetical protein
LDEDSEEMDRRSEQLLSIPALLSGLSNRWNTYVVEMLSGKPDIAAQE